MSSISIINSVLGLLIIVGIPSLCGVYFSRRIRHKILIKDMCKKKARNNEKVGEVTIEYKSKPGRYIVQCRYYLSGDIGEYSERKKMYVVTLESLEEMKEGGGQ